jgi:CTP synthase (UTP-ammonia lyase)
MPAACALTIEEHPFYVATLFVPQLTSTRERPHPVIVAFVRAAQARRLSVGA